MDWEIYDGQLQRGPMPEEGVHDAIRSGLPRSAYVRQAGASDWLPIEHHPLFAVTLQNRGAPGRWPPPPPPPAFVGSAQPAAPVVTTPPPTMPYAVSRPTAGQAARRALVARGCLVQVLGIVLLLGAGYMFYSQSALALEALAGVAVLGLVLLLLGGVLDLKWVCGMCKKPIGRSVHVCPNCHATFT
jgi:hypothetical protein